MGCFLPKSTEGQGGQSLGSVLPLRRQAAVEGRSEAT